MAGGGARTGPAPRPDAAAAPETEARAEGDPRPEPRAKPQPETFEQVVALLSELRELRLAHHLHADVRPVRCQPGQLEINPGPNAPKDLAGRLSKQLEEATGRRWMVSLSSEPGEPTLAEREATAKQAAREGAMAHPLVQMAMETFPGARLRRILGDAPPTAAPDETGREPDDDFPHGDPFDDERHES
jgi:DNA polymerase-3 subunit gamma/tau